VNKIVRAVQRCSSGLSQVEPMRIASKTIGGLYDGATTREMDTISIDTAASLIAEEPQYSKLAARLLLGTIVKEVAGQNLHSFSQSLDYGYRQGIVNPATAEFVSTHAHHAIDDQLSDRFEFPAAAPGHRSCIPCQEPVLVHGATGRSGVDKLL
jgi:ribonucleoside-diphosphate reductase alpha chain